MGNIEELLHVNDHDDEEIDYKLSEDGKSITIDAVDEAIDPVQDFIREKLQGYGCEKKVLGQIRLAVEEIFINIISYAYRPEIGKAEIFCEVEEEPLCVTIQFMDSGKPFDPLAKKDVDDLEALFMEQEGGFGIHLVKRTMDAVDYSYEDGRNILTIHKKLITD
jgi:sigma-B regulation protein RsbU (phosphoserine phosphatase)